MEAIILQKLPLYVVTIRRPIAAADADRKNDHALRDIGNVVNPKPEDSVHDIVALDQDDQLAVTDYVVDLYEFYKRSQHWSRPHPDYMYFQVDINSNMRDTLCNWLIHVHHKFKLRPETLYLTIYTVDRYLSKEIVTRQELQLVGISMLLIACKYEERRPPKVCHFVSISGRAYTREQILAKEKAILNKLEWSLTVPTQYVFLQRFVKAALSDKEMEHMVYFFAELGLMQYSLITYSPSMVAAAAVYAARCTLQTIPRWSATLKRYTRYSEPHLLDCADILINSHSAAPNSKLKAVYIEYSSEEFGSVALHPPAAKFWEEFKLTFFA